MRKISNWHSKVARLNAICFQQLDITSDSTYQTQMDYKENYILYANSSFDCSFMQNFLNQPTNTYWEKSK